MATVTNAFTPTGDTSNTATYTSPSFTPAEGDLLIVLPVSTGTQTDPASVTASANGITFTQVLRATSNSSANSEYVFVANQLVPASPAAMTVTLNLDGDAGTGAVVAVARVSGMSKTGLTAIKQSTKIDNGAGATTPVFTFGANCDTNNPTLAVLGQVANVAGGSSVPPSGWTEATDVSYSTPTFSGSYVFRNSGFTGTTITWGDSETAHGGVAVELDASASGITQALPVATTTSTAQTPARVKTRAVPVTVSTGTAQALARVKRRALPVAVETDTAQPITRAAPTFNHAAETDTAQTVARRKVKALPTATETDTALGAAARSKRRALPLSSETETAQSLAARLKTRALPVAVETDAGQALGRRKVRPLPLSAETDTAQTIRRVGVFAPATEADAAQSLARVKSRALPVASETDAPLAPAARKTRALDVAAETDDGLDLTRVRRRALDVAAETEEAQPLVGAHVLVLLPAVEVDAARDLGGFAVAPHYHRPSGSVRRDSVGGKVRQTRSSGKVRATVKTGGSVR